MSVDLGIKIRGGKQLAVELSALGPRIELNALRSGLRYGANIIRDEARRRAPRRKTERPAGSPLRKQLHRRIVTLTRKARRGEAVVSVAARAPHAHLIEYGTGERFRRKYSDAPKHGRTGAVQGDAVQPFMRPAFDSKHHEALSQVARGVRLYLERMRAKGKI